MRGPGVTCALCTHPPNRQFPNKQKGAKGQRDFIFVKSDYFEQKVPCVFYLGVEGLEPEDVEDGGVGAPSAGIGAGAGPGGASSGQPRSRSASPHFTAGAARRTGPSAGPTEGPAVDTTGSCVHPHTPRIPLSFFLCLCLSTWFVDFRARCYSCYNGLWCLRRPPSVSWRVDAVRVRPGTASHCGPEGQVGSSVP